MILEDENDMKNYIYRINTKIHKYRGNSLGKEKF